MRAFLAIPIPAELQQPLAVAGLAFDDLKPVAAANLHVTIRFLGEIRDSRAVAAAVEPVCAAHAPFRVSLARLGCFPNRKRARVVWVGLDEGDLQAGALATGIDAALEPLGFEPEGRPWHGHVTLGRFRSPKRLRGALLDPGHVFGGFEAEEVVLFASELRPDGAVHTPVHRLALGT